MAIGLSPKSIATYFKPNKRPEEVESRTFAQSLRYKGRIFGSTQIYKNQMSLVMTSIATAFEIYVAIKNLYREVEFLRCFHFPIKGWMDCQNYPYNNRMFSFRDSIEISSESLSCIDGNVLYRGGIQSQTPPFHAPLAPKQCKGILELEYVTFEYLRDFTVVCALVVDSKSHELLWRARSTLKQLRTYEAKFNRHANMKRFIDSYNRRLGLGPIRSISNH